MGLQNELGGRSAIGVLVVIVLLAAVAFIVMRRPVDPVGTSMYFYDLKSGKIFAAPRQNPPIKTAEGNTAVRAQVYSCGACEPSQWFVMMIETNEGNPPTPRVAAAPEPGAEPKWLDPISPATRALVAAANKRCAGSTPILCMP